VAWNKIAGFIYAALGFIYAVLMALVVIAVWEEFQTASETVEQEANALAEIFWLGKPGFEYPVGSPACRRAGYFYARKSTANPAPTAAPASV
jgi:hypothetical protein